MGDQTNFSLQCAIHLLPETPLDGDTPEELDAREFLQRGFSVLKKTRRHSSRLLPWKSRYLWLSKDMLHLNWCHGDKPNVAASQRANTRVEVKEISSVEKMLYGSKVGKRFTLKLNPSFV